MAYTETDEDKNIDLVGEDESNDDEDEDNADEDGEDDNEEIAYEEIKGYYCEDCDEAFDSHDGPLYECETHDVIYTRGNSADGESSKCPEGEGHRGRKIAKMACPQCCAHEVEEVDAWYCLECDEAILPFRWSEHLADSHED